MRLVLVQRLIQRIPHDQEWELPFMMMPLEFLILETFQAGLSWITIQQKENFKKAFDNFDYKK
jgi:DNA-3-methyladenine glycosylase I